MTGIGTSERDQTTTVREFEARMETSKAKEVPFTIEWMDGHIETYKHVEVEWKNAYIRVTYFTPEHPEEKIRYEIIPAVVIRRTWYD